VWAKAEIVVARPPETVWPYVGDPENWSAWAGEQLAPRLTSGGSLGEGSTFEYTFVVPLPLGLVRFPIRARGRIVEYVPGRSLTALNRPGPFLFRERFELSPAGDATELTYSIHILPASRLLQRLLRRPLRRRSASTERVARAELQAIKRVAEDAAPESSG
jgi:carbon monoxide dehydrogenase subunit G